MKIKKIKQVRPGFASGSGPWQTTTIGFEADGRVVILGEVYEGPYMDDAHGKLLEELERLVDNLCALASTRFSAE